MVLQRSLYDKSLDTIENELTDVYSTEKEQAFIARKIKKSLRYREKNVEVDYSEIASVSKITFDSENGLFVKLSVDYFVSSKDDFSFAGDDEFREEHADVTLLLLVGKEQRVTNINSNE